MRKDIEGCLGVSRDILKQLHEAMVGMYICTGAEGNKMQT